MSWGYCCPIGGQNQVPLSLAVGKALGVLDYRVDRTGPQSLAMGLWGSWAVASQPHWWVGLSLGTNRVEEDLKMVLTSTSVLIAERAPQNAYVPRGSLICLLPFQKTLQDQ